METRDESLDLIFLQESGLQIVQERQEITWRHAIAQVNYLFRDERHDLVNYIPVSKSIPPPSTKIHWLRIEDLDAEWRWLQ